MSIFEILDYYCRYRYCTTECFVRLNKVHHTSWTANALGEEANCETQETKDWWTEDLCEEIGGVIKTEDTDLACPWSGVRSHVFNEVMRHRKFDQTGSRGDRDGNYCPNLPLSLDYGFVLLGVCSWTSWETSLAYRINKLRGWPTPPESQNVSIHIDEKEVVREELLLLAAHAWWHQLLGRIPL